MTTPPSPPPQGPTPLTPEQQQRIVAGIGQAVAALVPPGWRQLRVEHRAMGRHLETDVSVAGPDGVSRPLPPSPEVVRLLGTLRTGMYLPGQGTWLAAVLLFDAVQGASVDFTLDREPRWRRVPPPIGFADELRFFPRAEQHIPAWLRARAGLPPVLPAPPPAIATPRAQTPDGLRMPRVYDGLDEAGRPVVTRERLSPAEREQVLSYLDAAPVVLASRTYDADALDPSRTDAVPLNFRTDGSWVWPGAVAYYLREHDVAPDPELLTHIRGLRFTLPEVGERERDLALTALTGAE